MIRLATIMTLALLGLALPAPAGAESTDYHTLFETRCGRCHGHAGDFSRANLTVADGELRGLGTGAEVGAFLGRHYGRLSAAEIDDLVQIFRKQVTEGGRFRQACGLCHGSARGVAQRYLIVTDGRLVGRYSGRDMREFLAGHGRPDADGAVFFYDLLLNVTSGGAGRGPPAAAARVVDLKFLPLFRRACRGNFKFKTTLDT